jgi:hypothetical protein
MPKSKKRAQWVYRTKIDIIEREREAGDLNNISHKKRALKGRSRFQKY